MLRRMLQRWFPRRSDDELKEAARRETDRLRAELTRQGIRVEMATQRTLDDLESQLRRGYTEARDA